MTTLHLPTTTDQPASQARNTMSEPTTTAAAGTLSYKVALFLLPIVASMVAFWLGLRFVPLRVTDPRGDLLNRVLACLVSGFLLGVPALVLLMQHLPGTFDAGVRLAQLAGLPDVAGMFAITGCIFVLSSIPGPWLVAGVFLWLQRREGRDIVQLAQDASAGLGGMRQALKTGSCTTKGGDQ